MHYTHIDRLTEIRRYKGVTVASPSLTLAADAVRQVT